VVLARATGTHSLQELRAGQTAVFAGGLVDEMGRPHGLGLAERATIGAAGLFGGSGLGLFRHLLICYTGGFVFMLFHFIF